jgi:hypothetical protein
LASNTYDFDIVASMVGISSARKTYRLYIIQPLTTIIIPPLISPILYYKRETKLTSMIGKFSATDSRFPLKYSLTDFFGFAFDSSVIEFFTMPSVSIAVFTTITSKIGKYSLMLTA